MRRLRSRRPTDADICRVLVKNEDFMHAFPKLKRVVPKRLQNLVAKAKKLRRAYLADLVTRCAYYRRVGPEESEDGGFLFGDRPAWISGGPTAFSPKLSKGGPPGHRKKKYPEKR